MFNLFKNKPDPLIDCLDRCQTALNHETRIKMQAIVALLRIKDSTKDSRILNIIAAFLDSHSRADTVAAETEYLFIRNREFFQERMRGKQ